MGGSILGYANESRKTEKDNMTQGRAIALLYCLPNTSGAYFANYSTNYLEV